MSAGLRLALQGRRRISVIALAATLAVGFTSDAGHGPVIRGAWRDSLPAMTEPTHLQFVAAKSEPLPAPPELGNGPALSTHEVFGFAPYWTLPNESGYPLAGLTTVAYFGV